MAKLEPASSSWITFSMNCTSVVFRLPSIIACFRWKCTATQGLEPPSYTLRNCAPCSLSSTIGFVDANTQ